MTIKHVIIPVDFSEVSIAAVDHGRWLADRSTSTVELVAVTTPRYANVTTAALTSLASDQEFDASFRVLETESDDIEGKLVDAVLSSTDTLWCVGSHGRTALGELLFGSVSADLVRDAEVPIAVVGPHAVVRQGADVLAVALDGSEVSESIIAAAVTAAADLGLKLRLLQVGIGHVPPDSNDNNYLAGLSKHLPDPDHADYDTLYGEAGDQLVAYVERSEDIADARDGHPRYPRRCTAVGAEHGDAGDAPCGGARVDAPPTSAGTARCTHRSVAPRRSAQAGRGRHRHLRGIEAGGRLGGRSRPSVAARCCRWCTAGTSR